MNATAANLCFLQEEYETMMQERDLVGPGGEVDWEELQRSLIADAEWTPRGASTLVDLVQSHGAFVLRNAAALALALGIEDGEEGL